MEKLTVKTTQLKNHLHSLLDRYEKNKPPENMNDKEFFLKMKCATASIYDLLEKWEALTLKEIKKRTIMLHPHQIVSTRENIELLILHSYYMDARHRRYMELNQSSVYILGQILNEIKAGE